MGDHYKRWGKRTVDVIAGTAALIVLSPLLLALVTVSAITYRAWPIFSHERAGRDGRPFRLHKVRTLHPRTASYTDKFSLAGEAAIPRHMQLIRRAHLDEIPQFLHVIRGEMSLVGPRPEMAHLHAAIDPKVADLRLSVRPGLTGLWQISPHCTGLISERPEYDCLYALNHGARLDAWLLFATTKKILFGQTTPLHMVPRSVLPKATSGERRADHEAGSVRVAAALAD